MNMNISCRIANADTQCGRITNPPERDTNIFFNVARELINSNPKMKTIFEDKIKDYENRYK